MENMTLLIDTQSRDLVFDENGFFKKIFDKDTTVQNVRHALLTWKAEFFADETHGTDYERILGVNQNELDDDDIKEVIREAVFQEPDILRIDEIFVTYNRRNIIVKFSATLVNNETITLEVIA